MMNLQYIKYCHQLNAPSNILQERLKAHLHTFHKVVDFNHSKEKIVQLNFTKENKELDNLDLTDTEAFTKYVHDKLKKAKAKFGIGGYDENRVVYKRSELFEEAAPSKSPPTGGTLPTYKARYKNSIVDNEYSRQRILGVDEISSQFGEKDLERTALQKIGLTDSQISPSTLVEKGQGDEGRSLHLGIDIWGEEGTKVYAPLGGMVHSYAFNKNFGDYGATLILLHQLDTVTFYTLYGHLSLDDIAKVTEFQYIVRGHVIGHFGKAEENGHWPPHLHFQIIKDIRTYKGDYPGVCKLSERKKYLDNCPDPDLILGMMEYAE
jgi:murein DD-endopeptidase MepM/ murein hydrolase activator NlpD